MAMETPLDGLMGQFLRHDGYYRNHTRKNEGWADKRKEKIWDAAWSDKGDGFAALKQVADESKGWK